MTCSGESQDHTSTDSSFISSDAVDTVSIIVNRFSHRTTPTASVTLAISDTTTSNDATADMSTAVDTLRGMSTTLLNTVVDPHDLS
jgi:hypothetical protein